MDKAELLRRLKDIQSMFHQSRSGDIEAEEELDQLIVELEDAAPPVMGLYAGG